MTATQVDRARAAREVEKARAHFPPGVSSDYIYVKIFKRIPQIDIEMLFLNTKVAFRPFDKLKVMVTAGGGTLAGVAGTATKLLAATNPFRLAFGVFGLSAALKRLRAGGLVTADKDGKFSAIAPEDARAHLDRLWDRLLDVDSLDRQATSAGA